MTLAVLKRMSLVNYYHFYFWRVEILVASSFFGPGLLCSGIDKPAGCQVYKTLRNEFGNS